MDVQLLNWIKDGKYRLKTLMLLEKTPLLPSELSHKLNINRASMSRILKDLKGKELIDNVTSKSRTTTYFLTKKGEKLIASVGDINV